MIFNNCGKSLKRGTTRSDTALMNWKTSNPTNILD